MEAVIFDIQRFSVYDGPGLRTTIFFKGCNLRCRWCHNPESWDPQVWMSFVSGSCIGCGSCSRDCPSGALSREKEGFSWNKDICISCGNCTRECYAGALKWVGRSYTPERLMQEIREETAYYRSCSAGGGVTFSGGECMLYPGFLEAVLRHCAQEGIHTAVDTAGDVPFAAFERIIPDTDLFLFDIKALDPIRHKHLTGRPNARILENLDKLLAAGQKIWIRIPVIPGGNLDEMEAIAGYLSIRSVAKIQLLPYHKMGEGKREILLQAEESFRHGKLTSYPEPSPKEMETVRAAFLEAGIEAELS